VRGQPAIMVRLARGNAAPPLGRADPVCRACSEPVASGTLRLYEGGDFYHASCRGRQRQLEALEHVNRTEATPSEAARLVNEPTPPRRRHADPPAELSACPVCQQPAMVADWGPGVIWLVVEGCPCGGFSVATEALEWRLPHLSPPQRVELAATIQGVRAMGRAVWLTTAVGGISGRLVVRTERPEPPT
jgi:hypothetical protein